MFCKDLFWFFLQNFERRAIGIARILTLRLKRGFNTLSGTALKVLPTGLGTKVSDAKAYTEELYKSFADVSHSDEYLEKLTRTVTS